MENNICEFCSKEFSSKYTLINHQRTVKSCLKLQGKEEKETEIECENCNKVLSIRSYKKHKPKCDEKYQEEKEIEEVKERDKERDKEIKELKLENETYKKKINSLEKDNEKQANIISSLKKEKEVQSITIMSLKKDIENLEKEKNIVIMSLEKENKKLEKQIEKLENQLEKQIEKIQSTNASISMKLAEKNNTVNNVNNKTVVINNNPLTNEVLRQYANTFTIDNAYNINGITKHLTSSLENHIVCTDPSRNIFKYTNEKDQEIIDKDLEILLPHYLTSIKDRNNFLYKEVFEYFKKNNVSINVQTDYKIFYESLNSIINRNSQNNKYAEKCKQHMIRECKRRFLDKNKNKDKEITKKLSVEEVMKNIIETGGTVNDFIKILFPTFLNEDVEETEDEMKYRRDMEDMFIKKKREWKEWREYKDEKDDTKEDE